MTRKTFALLVVATCLGATPAKTQGQQESCTRVYVDPGPGSNVTGTGLIGNPFKTITHAIDHIAQQFPQTPPVGTVVLLPGRYTWIHHDPNNTDPDIEVWPIKMRTGISLQGTNALNTILEGPGPAFSDPLFPPTPNRVIDFLEADGSFTNTVVNGVSIRNAAVGVNIQACGIALEPSLSNCFIFGNCAGIAISAFKQFGCAPDPGDDEDGDGQPEHRPTILHCTISDNEIGIWDGAIEDDSDPQNIVLKGEAESAIVNSLIFDNLQTDLQGVDAGDLLGSAFAQAQTQSANFCNLGIPGLFDGDLLPDVTPDGDPSDSAANLGPETQQTIYVNNLSGDYRLLPRAGTTDNPLRGAGNPGVETSSGLEWTVGNGTTTTTGPGPLGYCAPNARVVDAEGHGNPRYELDYDNPDPVTGEFPNRIDVGADEMGQLIIFGYNNFSTTFGGGNYTPFAYMTPNPTLPGTVRRARHYKAQAGTGYQNMQPFITPGIHPDGTFPCISRAVPNQQCDSEFCIDQTTLLPGFPQMINMDLKGIPTTLTDEAASTPAIRINREIIPRNGGQGTTCLSNLQSYIVQ